MSGSYIPEYVYGLIPGTYGELGLIPWPKHLQPRKASAPEAAGQPAPEATPSLVNAAGVFFVTLSPDDRASIAAAIDRLIAMLDAMDGDENLEATGDLEEACEDEGAESGDFEPTLGAPEGAITDQARWSHTGYGLDECEDENEHGGDINDEPQDDDEREPSLGWSEMCGQGPTIGVPHEPAVQSLDAVADNEEDGNLDFRGDGYREARQALRDRRVSQFPREYAERVTIMPDGEQFRTFVPIRSAQPKKDDKPGDGGLTADDFNRLPWA